MVGTLRGRQLTPMQPLQASLETVGTSMGVTPSTRGTAIRVSSLVETDAHLNAHCMDNQKKASLLVSSWIVLCIFSTSSQIRPVVFKN